MGALFTGALSLALPTPQPVPAAMTPSGPLARYLAHPGATTARLFHHLAQVLAHLPKAVGAGALAVTLIGVVAVTLARRTPGAPHGRGRPARAGPHPARGRSAGGGHLVDQSRRPAPPGLAAIPRRPAAPRLRAHGI